LNIDPDNITAKYNLGNALIKQRDAIGAQKQYDDIINKIKDDTLKSQALYNKGVALAQQNKLPEAIDAFKQALTLSPNDNDIRENLQKAINDLKKQQPPPPKQSNKKQQPPPPKKQQQNQQMMQQKFQQLEDQEKQLQKKLQKQPLQDQPEKDW
jgi:Ca-activated chloride channel family protein